MTPVRFEGLCASLCELFGIAPPAIAEDASGVSAVTFEVDGVATSVMHIRALGDSIVIAAKLGSVGPDEELHACRAFLEANFLMAGRAASPSIGRDPATGDFVVNYARPLDTATAPDLYQAVMRMTELATQWRAHLVPARPAVDSLAMLATAHRA
ncbi:MAG TPA: CesT family type III secretion system chaperone [Ramlibacter sp.]|uniref:CesT family type III secretion system chaperone n=1 Tax=Ramlibacter sp. TaxID=1917967 RepID=UPI002C9A047F|nr:CesT family type III secretion system chaperone [Ramlibacter sp.]HVZ44817.1 CesT family type III secretion system chaperone [Ramlibacter sp.]